MLLPPELVGARVGGAGRAHHRPAGDQERLRAWAGLYKELRGLLHSGRTVRADDPGERLLLHGVVGPPGAVYA